MLQNADIFIIGLRPYYISTDFSHEILTTIYVPNNAVAYNAALEISEVLRNYGSSASDALFLINGDFNHCQFSQSGNQSEVNTTSISTAPLEIQLLLIIATPTLDSYSAITSNRTSTIIYRFCSGNHVRINP